jgi:hypothetical protein
LQQSFLTDSEPFSETWPRAGMTRGGHAYELPTVGRLTRETDGGSLPTPTADAAVGSIPTLEMAERFRRKNRSGSFVEAVAATMWPTPTRTSAPNQPGLHSFNGQYWRKPDGRKHQTDLALAVMGRAMWPTPNASDNRDRGNLSDPSVQRRIAMGKQIGLSMMVKHPTPRVADSKGQGMSVARKDKPDSLSAQNGGSLSPPWVEWLMAWPLGWTASKHWATVKSHYKRPSRGESSRVNE